MTGNRNAPKPGQMVIARHRPGVVRDVEAYNTDSPEGTLHFVHVEYIDGWTHPDSDRIIWERETNAEPLGGPTLPKIDDPSVKADAPDRFFAFVDANQWEGINRLDQLVSTVKGKTSKLPLVSTWHSAVQIEDYQIYPVLKSLLMPRVSLLLADDVGLGKTIEAGLIVTELFSRRRIRRVLIICPASLQHQWKEEMSEKFHLEFSVINREETFRLQRDLGIDANPWTSFPRIITSMDYLSQPDVLEHFRASARGITGDNKVLPPWDLLIVDEAHNFSPSMFGDETRRCSMLREIRNYFEHKLFLTATPHNGYTVSFSGLLELLDPVRFQQKAELESQDHEQVQVAMVRRLKSELNKQGMFKRFSERKVEAIKIARFYNKETDLFDALREYKEEGLKLLAKLSDKERNLGQFIFTLLTKRLLSSSYAFARTWYQHIAGFEFEAVEFDQADHSRSRAETAVTDDEEKDRREEDAARQTGSWLTQLGAEFREKALQVSQCLADLGWTAEIISEASAKNAFPEIAELLEDSKWDELQNWIEKYLIAGKDFKKDERVILFTEYKHTLDYLMYRFGKQDMVDPVVKSLFGGASIAYREAIKEEFNDPESPLRILVATDTASEGLNMQNSCRYVVHQEIPWNPMRLEQRNGRVDRHGQMRDVFVFHFSCDEDEDLKFLDRVVQKVNQVREDLGSVGQVIDHTIMEHFTGSTVSPDEFENRVNAVRDESDESGDMAGKDSGRDEDYVRAMQELRATELSLGLTPESLARMLTHAVDIEKGRLESAAEPNVFRMTRVPPSWDGLVNETLRLRGQQKSMPKIVFDPSYFEEKVDGRTVYRPRKDVALLRLGHPIMRRALGVLKKRMWDPENRREISRWTVHGAPLPSGLECILVLYCSLQASNALRENIHSEVLSFPFQITGETLKTLDADLFEKIRAMDAYPLPPDELTLWANRIRELWLPHRDLIVDFIASEKEKITSEFKATLKESFNVEKKNRQLEYDNRMKELEKQPRTIEKLKKDILAQERKVAQKLIFAYMQAVEEMKLADLKWKLEHSDSEQIKKLLQREKERIVGQVLPRRFELASLDLHPLAVEYIARSKKGGDA